jgi:hypothetical protein
VIKVFYVACPPCNAIAPHLEPLYQTWGGGAADVQFIELSTKQTDTDALINGYKSNHNTTFPACGGQGSSVSAVSPYTSGMFGQYTGTPTFVVIAPDRTVNYDVYGAGISGTIEALHNAIAATGATGIISGSNNPDPQFPLQLLSNLVEDQLVFRSSEGSGGEFEVALATIDGKEISRTKVSVEGGQAEPMPTGQLSSGPWICTIQNLSDKSLVSYLFIKR